MERGEALRVVARGLERAQQRRRCFLRSGAAERQKDSMPQRRTAARPQQRGQGRDRPVMVEGAQRIDAMIAHQRVRRAGERAQDDVQCRRRAEPAQGFDATGADRRGTLFRQAVCKCGQGIRRAELTQRRVDRLSDRAVGLRKRQAIEQRPDGFRLPPEAERMGGLFADRRAVERQRLDQHLEGHGAVLPAVGRRRARRCKQQDQGEHEHARRAMAFSDHPPSIPESAQSCQHRDQDRLR